MNHNSLCYGFMKSLATTPQAPALTIQGETQSYEQLNCRVNAIEALLCELGVDKGDRIGLHLSKSMELYAALLAVLRRGAVFVPLEPEYPEERVGLIIEDADLKVILTADKVDAVGGFNNVQYISGLDPLINAVAQPALVEEEDLAYILYTSGSTGRPKGVMINHKNVVGYIRWATDFFNYTAKDHIAGHSDLMFDLSIMDTFCAWEVGAHLFPVTSSEKMMCGHFIRKNKITLWFSVPSVLNMMKKLGEFNNGSLGGLKKMLFCGEPLTPHLTRDLMLANSHLEIFNLYGPTEATIACSVFQLNEPPSVDSKSISIGFQTGNTRIKVVNDQGQIATEGCEGKVYIVGDQVGPGYWNNSEETHKRFICDPTLPQSDSPCFFTGDIVRIEKDGPHFVGRKDNQVKVNGYRVELNDIEHSLMKISDVIEAAVQVVDKNGQGQELVGFIESSVDLMANDIIQIMRSHLPDYMVPKKYIVVESLPRTLNGKLDRKQLPGLLA